MYKTWPKCGHTRSENDAGPDTRCPACGLLFAKWLSSVFVTRGRLRADRPGFHDWQNILSRLGLLEYDGAIGSLRAPPA